MSKGKCQINSPLLSSFDIAPVTDRYYKVIRLVKVSQEREPGIYSREDVWTTSYFYITDQGVNHWISKLSFVAGIHRERKELKKLWKEELEAGLDETKPERPEPKKPLFPEPRPEAAIWVETETRPGGIFFKPYLTHATSRGVDKPSVLLPTNTTTV